MSKGKPNRRLRIGNATILFLTNRHGDISAAVVLDSDDVALVADRRWYARTAREKTYACTNIGVGKSRRGVLMHDVIMNPAGGFEVDHRDGNGLNNRRSNLRNVSHRDNTLNRRVVAKSGYKGVSKSGDRWRSVIHVKQGEQRYLGTFGTPEAAAQAYNDAAVRLFGEFAWLNRI